MMSDDDRVDEQVQEFRGRKGFEIDHVELGGISMSIIHRHELTIVDTPQIVSLPSAHTLLSIAPGRNGYYIDLWVLGESRLTHEVIRTFRIFGTGHPIPNEEQLKFVGTAVMPDDLVWHVFADEQWRKV